MPNLKSDLIVWLVGSVEPLQIVGEETGPGGHPIPILSHYKRQLPTNHEALKHLFHLKKIDMKGQKLSAISEKVVTDIFAIWNMAKIPTITKINAKIKLEKMYNKWLWLQKSEKKETEKEKQNRAEFTNCFPKLFDITSPT